MAKFILGRKLNMTQKYTEDGRAVPVTVVEAGPCTITQVKDSEGKDGYSAVQVGYGKKNKLNKPLAGHLKGLDKFRYLQEFRVDNTDSFAKGKIFDVSSFEVGDILKVSAVSKGKGFQGVVKRHGFHGSPASHGHKDQLRMPGSIGATDAARVFKGTRMGGRMGGETNTVSNIELVDVDTEKNLLYIKGAVPGSRNTLVTILADGEIKFVEKPKSPSKDEEKKQTKKEENKEKLTENIDKEKEVKKESPAQDKTDIQKKENKEDKEKNPSSDKGEEQEPKESKSSEKDEEKKK